jgi:hypothetical protein
LYSGSCFLDLALNFLLIALFAAKKAAQASGAEALPFGLSLRDSLRLGIKLVYRAEEFCLRLWCWLCWFCWFCWLRRYVFLLRFSVVAAKKSSKHRFPYIHSHKHARSVPRPHRMARVVLFLE